LSRKAVAWVLSRALALSTGTCVVALVLDAVLPGEVAERLATAAYLAAVFATIVFVVARLVPAVSEGPAWLTRRSRYGYALGVVVCLGTLAALAALPGAELAALCIAFGLIIAVVLVRCGAPAAINAAMVRGGANTGVIRYAVLAAACALVLSAMLPESARSVAAFAAYEVAVVLTFALAIALIAPTPAGLQMLRSIQEAGRFANIGGHFYARATAYAVAAAVTAIAVAALLSGAGAELFSTIAYLAAAAVAVALAMECRRSRGSSDTRRG